MARAAEAVVYGRFEAGRLGRPTGDSVDVAHYIELPFHVSDTYSGSVPSPTIQVELFTMDRNAVPSVNGLLAGREAVLFLRNKGDEAEMLGFDSRAVERERAYYRLVSSQGGFISLNGRADAPWLQDEGGFAAQLEGIPFADLQRNASEAARRDR